MHILRFDAVSLIILVGSSDGGLGPAGGSSPPNSERHAQPSSRETRHAGR